MPKLINLHDFAVRVEALGREFAPYETVVVEDEQIVRNAIATGVLHSDLEELSEADEKALASVEKVFSEIAQTWHAEHGRSVPAEAKSVIEVKDEQPKTIPFVSTAQQNHVVGLAKGDAALAGGTVDVEPNPNPAPFAPKAGELPVVELPPEADPSLGVVE